MIVLIINKMSFYFHFKCTEYLIIITLAQAHNSG